MNITNSRFSVYIVVSIYKKESLNYSITVDRRHVLISGGRSPMNSMTRDPEKVWPKGIVYYEFHITVGKLRNPYMDTCVV